MELLRPQRRQTTQGTVKVNMQSQLNSLKPAALILLLLAGAFLASCGGSKANVRKDDSAGAAQPVVEVTTAAAIKRDLPRFFEATGSLAGDEQTDVAPQTSGKVVA